MKNDTIKTEIILNALREPFYLYRINAACEALGVSRKTIEGWINAGDIKTVLVGNHENRIAHFELMRFVAHKYQGVEIKLQQFINRAS